MKKSKKFKSLIAVFTFTVFFLSSCVGPYQQQIWVDIKPSETAFVIPLEEGNKVNQKQLKSVEYLQEKKVAAKRIYIPTKQISTGRMWNDYKYIPTVSVIVVDRAAVTCEWTYKPNDKSAKQEQKQIVVESQNSIGFSLAITVTAWIPEEDAEKFLYYYGGRNLDDVLNHNVRSFIQDNMSSGFGQLHITACQLRRKDVWDTMKVHTIKQFSAKGIHIDNIGVAGEFHFIDPKVQEGINNEFIAQKRNDAATQEAMAAEKFAKIGASIRGQKELEADINFKNAMADAARTGKLPMPGTLVLGEGMNFMDLWSLKNIKK